MFARKISQYSQVKTFIKKRLEHRCFRGNTAKFLRTPILKNICGKLLVNIKSKFISVAKSLLILHSGCFLEYLEKVYKSYESVARKE